MQEVKKHSKGQPGDTGHGGGGEPAAAAVSPRTVKVKLAYKLTNFVCAVIALSWFFEGWRKINESLTLPHMLILLAGILLTLVFLGIHAYWVYIEEKLKGTLKKRVGLFERVYLSSRKSESHIAAKSNKEEE